jgi:hypothetical protein
VLGSELLDSVEGGAAVAAAIAFGVLVALGFFGLHVVYQQRRLGRF